MWELTLFSWFQKCWIWTVCNTVEPGGLCGSFQIYWVWFGFFYWKRRTRIVILKHRNESCPCVSNSSKREVWCKFPLHPKVPTDLNLQFDVLFVCSTWLDLVFDNWTSVQNHSKVLSVDVVSKILVQREWIIFVSPNISQAKEWDLVLILLVSTNPICLSLPTDTDCFLRFGVNSTCIGNIASSCDVNFPFVFLSW